MANEMTRVRGDTYPFSFTVRRSGRIFDLTDCTMKLTVSAYENPTTESPAFTLTGTAPDPTTGVATFAPSAANVDLLGDYFYDVQITDTDGYIHTPIKSTITFTQDITKA